MPGDEVQGRLPRRARPRRESGAGRPSLPPHRIGRRSRPASEGARGGRIGQSRVVRGGCRNSPRNEGVDHGIRHELLLVAFLVRPWGRGHAVASHPGAREAGRPEVGPLSLPRGARGGTKPSADLVVVEQPIEAVGVGGGELPDAWRRTRGRPRARSSGWTGPPFRGGCSRWSQGQGQCGRGGPDALVPSTVVASRRVPADPGGRQGFRAAPRRPGPRADGPFPGVHPEPHWPLHAGHKAFEHGRARSVEQDQWSLGHGLCIVAHDGGFLRLGNEHHGQPAGADRAVVLVAMSMCQTCSRPPSW